MSRATPTRRHASCSSSHSSGERDAACERAASCLIRHQHAESGGVATYCRGRPDSPVHGRRPLDAVRGLVPSADRGDRDGRPCARSSCGRSAEADAAWRYVRSQQRGRRQLGRVLVDVAALRDPAGGGARASRSAITNAVGRAAEWAMRSQADGDGAFATALSLSVLLAAGASGQPVERAIVEARRPAGGRRRLAQPADHADSAPRGRRSRPAPPLSPASAAVSSSATSTAPSPRPRASPRWRAPREPD